MWQDHGTSNTREGQFLVEGLSKRFLGRGTRVEGANGIGADGNSGNEVTGERTEWLGD